MEDIEKVKTGLFEMLQRDTWKDIDPDRERFQPILNDALEALKELQELKGNWILDIDLYIADAEDSAKNPATRSAKGYAVGLSYGLNIAKEIIEGKRNHG